MDVGRTLEKGALGGRSFFQRTIDGLSKISAFMAAVLSFIARRSERMANGLDRSARWLHAKAVGVPLVPQGADVAGEDWEEPALLPDAPEPPPIPPAAFFRPTPTAQDAEWSAALAAAKATPEPEPTEEEWAALLAAKKAEAQAELQRVPVVTKTVEIAPLGDEPKATTPAPTPKMGELRVGPRSATVRAVVPSQKPAARETTPKPAISDPQTTATRKAISAALRS